MVSEYSEEEDDENVFNFKKKLAELEKYKPVANHYLWHGLQDLVWPMAVIRKMNRPLTRKEKQVLIDFCEFAQEAINKV
jgi:hypothetical protein